MLYVNDIFDIKFKGNLILFADDTALTYTNENINDLYVDMQHDLDLLNFWLYNNQLTLNISKTKYMIIENDNKQIDSSIYNLKVRGTIIQEVQEIKYLGLYIQNNLKWNRHLKHIKSKVSAICGVLHRLKGRAPLSILRSIYFAHMQSHLTYLAPVWGTALPQYELNELQVIQNNAIRKLYSYDYKVLNLSTAEVMKNNNILDIRNLIKFETAVFYYKIENKLIRNNYIPIKNSNIHSFNTRNKFKYITNKIRTNFGRDNVFRAGALLFNSISDCIKFTPSISIFKQKFKKMLLSP